MKSALFILLMVSINQCSSFGQLADGSTAPDFMLIDVNGNTQHLYGYLDSGKTVYLDIFAAHCPTCWTYHNTNAIRDLYDFYGPTGTVSQEVMVLALEYDEWNGMNELSGISGSTQGDWLNGINHPVINPEGADRTTLFTNYAITFYPLVYVICPDRKIKYIGTPSTNDAYAHVANCFNALDEETINEGEIFYDLQNKELHFSTTVTSIWFYDLYGKIQMSSSNEGLDRLKIHLPQNGIYFAKVSSPSGIYSLKFLYQE